MQTRKPFLPLDHPLLKFSHDPLEWWTVRDAVRGLQIFGGIGSGKSSGSGKTVAKAFLKNGFGGVVLCAKPDERTNWEKIAKELGRSNDLIIFKEGSEYEFNPLQYEMTREGKGAGEIFNLTNLFMEIYRMGNRFSGGGGSSEKERYWDNALKRCINRIIQLLQLANEEVSVNNMSNILASAPTQNEVKEMFNLHEDKIGELSQSNYWLQCFLEAGAKEETAENIDTYRLVHNYFTREFASLPENTRPTIVESFQGLAEPFNSGILKKHFSGSISPEIRPEETHQGKIIILDFPVKEYLQAGVYAQGIYKYLWQQATERRDPNQDLLPVFLWVDESQLFLSDYDQIFQTTARSSKACTVYISQNISNYYVSIGGRFPQPKVDSLLGNLGTKIFHANNDSVTNEWAAKTIGKAFQNVTSVNVGKHSSSSSAQQLHYQVEPRVFTTLKSGGQTNDLKVEGVVSIAGKKWSDGLNYRVISFKQNI
ncbi:MAG: TraM recognition domain-containing protein [Bacteroidota bacterium]